MTGLQGEERSAYVQKMFARIAPRYDLMNRLMTAGQDVRWRRQVIRLANLRPGSRLLDLGAGTGDLGREALRQNPASRVVAADFTLEMMHTGRQRSQEDLSREADFHWIAADALNLPFPSGYFDAVVSGFLLRNVAGLQRCLEEQFRVLKPGGCLVALDTTRPRQNLLTPLVRFHLGVIIPTLGGWITGEGEAYRYLPESTRQFLWAEQLAYALDPGWISICALLPENGGDHRYSLGGEANPATRECGLNGYL